MKRSLFLGFLLLLLAGSHLLRAQNRAEQTCAAGHFQAGER